MNDKPDPFVTLSNDLEERIRPMFAGHDPRVQGATLASLLACWLAGHPHMTRDRLLDAHTDTVRKLVPLYEQLLSARHRERRRKAHH